MSYISDVKADQRPTEEIISAALIEEDDDKYDYFVTVLQFRGTREVFDAARVLTASENENERCLGVDILAQLGIPERNFPEEALGVILGLLEYEESDDVIESVCIALGHNKDPRNVSYLVRFKQHPNPDVRYAVVFGLLTHEDEQAIEALIELSGDSDEDVRNWATFGLGDMIETDTPEIREALWRRVNDDFDAVRGEALKGLAKRIDEHVVEPLIAELNAIAQGDECWDYAFEAAEWVPDPRLYSALMAIKNSGIQDRSLERAIALCRVPLPAESEAEPDEAPTTCPVCGMLNAFRDPAQWEFCPRCGWVDCPEQRLHPDAVEYSNHSRSLN